jgi:preprotein translocase subunit SecG
MYGFLLAILILDGIFLSIVILLQSGKGGGLAAMGGGGTATEGLLGGRQATTFLTRASWAAGGVFMVLALMLSILSSRGQQASSILQQDIQPATAPVPVLPEADVSPGVPLGGADGATETEPPPNP